MQSFLQLKSLIKVIRVIHQFYRNLPMLGMRYLRMYYIVDLSV